MTEIGKVYLVGAGPGDPKLITVRGLELLQKADVIVYDRLVSPRLLRHKRHDAKIIDVGKRASKHTLPQEEISQLLINLARLGKQVVRLKGGDPSVFGRVGEEAQLLAEEGISFELIPGVSSALAVPLYAGIPVTHRDYTSSLAIVTGHEVPHKDNSAVAWDKLATGAGTLVFLMGVGNLAIICQQLIEHGRDPHTPAAVIRWGTTVDQLTITGTLLNMAEKAEQHQMSSPAIIVVGEVVKLRDKLKWFEQKPLFGKRIMVTRARSQASELTAAIEELGGEAVEYPLIHLKVPDDTSRLGEVCLQLSDYNWLVFTSQNGVEFFFEYLIAQQIDIRSIHQAKLAAVGEKTAEALAKRGLNADCIPAEFRGQSLAQTLQQQFGDKTNCLLLRADIADPEFPIQLAKTGASVTDVAVYQTVISEDHTEEWLEDLQEGKIDAVTFTSSSTVKQFVQAARTKWGGDWQAELPVFKTIAIGPVTQKTGENLGLQMDAVAAKATIEHLIEAIIHELSGGIS